MKRKLFLLYALLFVCLALLVTGKIAVTNAAKDRTYSDVQLIPHRHVGVVLGCPRLSHGRPSLFFKNRIDAAALLFQHGKVDYLIVSGNRRRRYDEPTDMKNALLVKGIPADRIYPDYAGVRTLDSVVRAKEIYGQDTFTVISQRFHNQRAIFLASHRGIDAIGFNAPDPDFRHSFSTHIREQFARVLAIFDVYLLHTQPHSLGQPIVIGNS
jgi:SanA protein